MFVKEPEANASFRDELLFEYSQSSSSELIFEIELGGDGVYQEVKKLYDVSDATINVAHVVANKFMTSPSSGETALETPDSGFGLVRVRCGDITSSAQYFVASREGVPNLGVMTSMPQSRYISYGESDEIWLGGENETYFTVSVETIDEGGESTTMYEYFAHESGITKFRFNTTDFGLYTKIAKVSLYADEMLQFEATYYYINRVNGAVRLAWIGGMGVIEHYTFAATNSLTISKSGVRSYEVESAYEAQSVIEALSEVLTSERVWIVEDQEYIEVELLSDEVVLNKSGELATVVYKFERYD